MKKTLPILLAAFALLPAGLSAATCWPAYEGSWTVPGNCDWPATTPSGYSVHVNGNINLQGYTVNVPANATMSVNLASYAISLPGTSAINLASGAKITNAPTGSYYDRFFQCYAFTYSYSSASTYNSFPGRTSCPAGTKVLNYNPNNGTPNPPTGYGSAGWTGGYGGQGFVNAGWICCGG